LGPYEAHCGVLLSHRVWYGGTAEWVVLGVLPQRVAQVQIGMATAACPGRILTRLDRLGIGGHFGELALLRVVLELCGTLALEVVLLVGAVAVGHA
jgi:hypothetical protein